MIIITIYYIMFLRSFPKEEELIACLEPGKRACKQRTCRAYTHVHAYVCVCACVYV